MSIAQLTDRQVIDYTIQFADNVDPTLPTTSSRVARYGIYLQELVIDVWMLGLPWTYRQTTLTIAATGQADLPTDFLEVGRSGYLANPDTGQPFTSKDYQELRLILLNPVSTKETVYALGEGKDDDPERYLYVPKGWVGYALPFGYRKVPPAVATSSDLGTTYALTEIPAVYHYSIFLPGMRWRAFEDLGDARAAIWLAKMQKGMEGLVSKEKSGPQKDSIKKLGGFGLRRMC